MLLRVTLGGGIMKKWIFVVIIFLILLILTITLFFPRHVEAPIQEHQTLPYPYEESNYRLQKL